MDLLIVSEVQAKGELIAPALQSDGVALAENSEPGVASPFTRATKNAIRTSLKASTMDGVFATVFSNITGGVLLTDFLLNLGATPTQIGMAAAIPLLANLLQPIGAHLSERTTSRHYFCLWIYGPARALWLLLVAGMLFANIGFLTAQTLIYWTLAIALLSTSIGAMGSAPWVSWMATLVPRRLRGRYFGFRNSAANLINLISVPLLGLLISRWGGGSLQGYSVALTLGILAGLFSLWFQNFMVDVNPQVQQAIAEKTIATVVSEPETTAHPLLQPSPATAFLCYCAFWMFAVNLSAPFFNLYLLDNLHLDVSQATIYNSLTAGANLLMLVLWGKLADHIGNRPLLLGTGIVVALTPLLWLLVGSDPLSVWLWLPLLHLLIGGAGAAVDLCGGNLQLGVAPIQRQSTYFGMVAAIAGVSGALGTMAGGFLAQRWSEGLIGLFVLSCIVRLVALVPLLLVKEDRSHSLRQLMRSLLPARKVSHKDQPHPLPLLKT